MVRRHVAFGFLGLAVILHGILSPLMVARPLAWLAALAGLVLLATGSRWRRAASRAAVVLILLVLPLVTATVVDVMGTSSNHFADGVPVGEYPGGELWWTGLFAVPGATLAVLAVQRGRVSDSAGWALGAAGLGLLVTFLYEPMGWSGTPGIDPQIYAFVLLSAAHLLVLDELWTAWRATPDPTASSKPSRGIEA